MDDATWASLGRFVETRYYRQLRADCVKLAAGDEARVDAALATLSRERFRARPVLRTLATWWSSAAGAAIRAQPWLEAELIASRGLPDPVRMDRLRNLSEEKMVQAGPAGEGAHDDGW